MSLLLRDGDYVFDECGGFESCSGADALMERILFKLQARRGGFFLLPELGSRLYRLGSEKNARRADLAKQFVEEALLGESDLRVDEVIWDEKAGTLTAQLRWQGEALPVRLKLND